jgi:hypothetical protein
MPAIILSGKVGVKGDCVRMGQVDTSQIQPPAKKSLD